MGILEKVYRNTGTDASEKCAFGNKEICWMDSSADPEGAKVQVYTRLGQESLQRFEMLLEKSAGQHRNWNEIQDNHMMGPCTNRQKPGSEIQTRWNWPTWSG